MFNESGDPRRRHHETLADPTIGDSILDRIVHNSYRLELTAAESMRKTHSPLKETTS